VTFGLAAGLAFFGGTMSPEASAEDLRQPYEIAADPGVHLLETSLKIQNLTSSYEYWKNVSPQGEPACYERTKRDVDLRMYGYPNPRGNSPYACSGTYCYDFPGPTFRMRRTAGRSPGDAFHMTLINNLDPKVPEGCRDSVAPYDWDTPPNCFHGEDVTNFHFHGFHVSPNPNDDGTYQDYIYVKVYPQGSAKKPDFPSVAVGKADYELPALTEGQHEGTHWYHPHKHGSTAQQVGNGMAGAFIVEGPYDDWVRAEVCKGSKDAGCRLVEQVMVVQQILSSFRFPPNNGAPTNGDFLVNGQLYPVVNVAPGEVQRWRIVNATMKAGSAFVFVFPAQLSVAQIGMDGVPFVKQNYVRQPLLGWTSDGKTCKVPEGDDPGGNGQPCIVLHPGNRADFLVQRLALKGRALRAAPGASLDAGAVPLVHLREFFSEQTRERTPIPLTPLTAPLPRTKSGCAYPQKPGLFRMNDCSGGGPGCKPKGMRLPGAGTYPALPALADVEKVARTRKVTYKMAGYTGAKFPANKNSSDPQQKLLVQINGEVGPCRYLLPKLTIDGRQFAAGQVDFVMQLGSAEEWAFANQAVAPSIPPGAPDCKNLGKYLTNEGCPGGVTPCLKGTVDGQTVVTALPVPSRIQHPVHLHVNPFQVRTCLDGRKCGPPYVWQDVMGLDVAGDPEGDATMRSKFLTFTGEYVMHCHILGHEDRGMMQNLQVCEGCPAR
jgi:FtsP/CotA-like multicopper oxidase with cupredoxin domain